MRVLLWMWFAPMAFFWTWYVMAANDVGYVFFGRDIHDTVFGIYAGVLGMDAEAIPMWVARACAVDSMIVLGVFALARRKRIVAWWRARHSSGSSGSGATSLSSAP